jgi:RNA recognition motif-containing protein
MSRIFVANIPVSRTENDLKHWFEAHGYEVAHVEVIRDSVTSEPRGVAFVELRFEWKAQDAIKDLHLKEFGGRRLTVNLETPLGSNRRDEASLFHSNHNR